MLLDLIRALPVAVFVAVVPGYFWAKLLLATDDRAERLAYSIAFSMTLVPAVALVPARLLGAGVTLAVGAASVAVVFAAGLAFYLRFGPSKGSGGAVASPPASLGPLELVLLTLALALSLGAALQILPYRQIMIPAALLVLGAGAVHAFKPRSSELQAQETRAEEPPDGGLEAGFETGSESLATRLVRSLALPAALALALFRGYSGPVVHDWPFIRGVDHYSHAVMAQLIMAEGKIEPYLIYPPGFHTMTAIVSRFSGLEPLEIFPVVAPALLVLPPLALYALARKLWGWEYGVAAAFLSILLGGTYFYFQDAMYPNMVTAQFLMVVAVAALIRLYESPSWRTGLLFALTGSATALYHPVASMYLALLLALISLITLPYLLVRERRRGVAMLSSFALLGALSVLYTWDTYNLTDAIGNLLGGSGGATGTAVEMAVGTQVPYPLEFLSSAAVTPPVTWLGLLGALLALGSTLRGWGSRTPVALSYLTLLLWVLVLLVGSNTSLSGFPQRFGRDLGIPLVLLAALALVVVVRSLPRQRRTAAVYLASFTLFVAGLLIWVHADRSLRYALAPNAQMTMTPQIDEAGEWLRANNTGGNIMVSPHANQVPSRMMLAMGNYSALQSFVPYQISHPRDLPPTGPEPLKDVVYVMQNPAGKRTPQLLEKREVRYIVLYKNMPDRETIDYWRDFDQRPDLYRTTFENRDVLIVTRREQPAAGGA